MSDYLKKKNVVVFRLNVCAAVAFLLVNTSLESRESIEKTLLFALFLKRRPSQDPGIGYVKYITNKLGTYVDGNKLGRYVDGTNLGERDMEHRDQVEVDHWRGGNNRQP